MTGSTIDKKKAKDVEKTSAVAAPVEEEQAINDEVVEESKQAAAVKDTPASTSSKAAAKPMAKAESETVEAPAATQQLSNTQSIPEENMPNAAATQDLPIPETT